MSRDSSNASLALGGNIHALSPYLNFDPAYVRQVSEPEFILPEGAGEKRGRFELSFLKIGSSCMTGAFFGGANGLYYGLKTATLEGQSGKLKRTTLFNHVMKKGAASANTLGVIAVIYSAVGILFEKTRGVENDELNTIAAATTTGMLFKSTAGLKKCAVGGGIGFALATLYCLWTSKEKLQQIRRSSFSNS